jgi:hypothetical protein
MEPFAEAACQAFEDHHTGDLEQIRTFLAEGCLMYPSRQTTNETEGPVPMQ